MPVSAVAKVGSCAARLAAGATDSRDELSLLAALAECLLIRPGITVAEKASAVNVSVASDFFMVGILILSLSLSENSIGSQLLGRIG